MSRESVVKELHSVYSSQPVETCSLGDGVLNSRVSNGGDFSTLSKDTKQISECSL
jgi:hypothetical protein